MKIPLSHPQANVRHLQQRMRTVCLPSQQAWRLIHETSGKFAIEAQVGLIIDLTNSWRYYDLEEVTCLGVAHIKIKCRGRGEVK